MGNKTFLRFSFLTFFLTVMLALRVSAQVNPYDIRPFNNKYAASHTEIPESLVPIDASYISSAYQWESSTRPTDGFVAIPGANLATYTFSAPLAQTTYFRRKFRIGRVEQVYSNVIKIEVVSVSWEDINYVREHQVKVAGQTGWKAIDQLDIGLKMQTTVYYDGIERNIQVVSRESATPSGGSTLWGDMVNFLEFDSYGRRVKGYLPYTTTSNTGKFKTSTVVDQASYYQTKFNESVPYAQQTFENSPLERLLSVKKSGQVSAGGNSASTTYELNDLNDDVQKFTIGYNPGDAPVNQGVYPAGQLYKDIQTDEAGKKVIVYRDNSGNEVLAKVQISDNPSVAHDGWICTYSIYDEFGLLRYRIQPEGVKWLSEHSWSFSSPDGQKILDEQCFRYEYNSKRQLILKKAPGIAPLMMIYDARDRLVFMQDGNQRTKSPAEWTVFVYDELDRSVLSFLYSTSKTIATLQSELDAASGVSALTISSIGVTVQVERIPVSSADVNNSLVSTILTVNFYDDYSYPGAKPFNTGFDNLVAYTTGAEPIVQTSRTLSTKTGTMTRILGTSSFLTATVYYDDKAREIQLLNENIKSGVDVTTMQYSWDNKPLSVNTKHTATGTAYTNYSVLSRNTFDKIGRVIEIERKYGANAFVKVASYEFDDLSKLKTKRLAPGYSGTGGTELESLTYTYDLHSKINGINKDYALKTPGSYAKWGHFFGLYIGYDNSDNKFSAGRLDGRVSGIMWNTQGDDAQRKFEFDYDNAGRLTHAAFNEKKTPSDSWSNGLMDFSSTGSAGKISYDLNGNLKSLQQKGVIPGAATPLLIDDLQYSYADFSNRLLKVTDNTTVISTNGKLSDFKDGANGSSDDYVYDENGNLVIDLNKDAKNLSGSGTNGIRYNYLDKPEEIKIVGKGVIKIIYDASGRKLQRQYTADGSSTTQIVSYINQFVYSGNDLQYMNFEEGRVRVLTAVGENNGYDFRTLDGTIDLPGGKRGAFDYYIRDYQANVRMILTIESHVGGNTCTMESSRATNEEGIFGQVDATGTPTGNNEVAARFPTASIPGSGWTANTSGYVSRVGALAASKVGPNSLMKVMAGDKISATTQYYYPVAVTNGTGTSILSDLLGSLVQTIGSGGVTGSVTKAAAGNIGTLLNASTPFASAISPDANNTAGSSPKAYLTLLFFDERFNFIEEGSQTLRVSQAGNGADPLTMLNIKAPKNGYAYVYISNESNEHVYFDNLQVSHNRGHILEENHYYAYGLRIAAISSRKLQDESEGQTRNNYLYNDKELLEEADLNWYDYGFRMYDPQIGRFPQFDPLAFSFPYYTPFQYAGCEPIANIDLDGLEPANVMSAAGQMLGNVTVTSTRTAATTTANVAATAANITVRVAFSSTVTYMNARGHTFHTPANLGNPGTVDYLDETWYRTGGNLTSYYTSDPLPPPQETLTLGKPKKLSWLARQYNYYTSAEGFMDDPILSILFSTANDIYVGGSTLLSAHTGVSRADITDLGGNPTTGDQRYMAGITTLASIFTLGAGSATASGTSTAAKGSAEVSSVLSHAEFVRIENAATRISKPITVIGSRATGTAGAYSDWDYVIKNLTNKSWKKIKNSLPGSRSTLDNTPRNIDIFDNLDPLKPHITINPRL